MRRRHLRIKKVVAAILTAALVIGAVDTTSLVSVYAEEIIVDNGNDVTVEEVVESPTEATEVTPVEDTAQTPIEENAEVLIEEMTEVPIEEGTADENVEVPIEESVNTPNEDAKYETEDNQEDYLEEDDKENLEKISEDGNEASDGGSDELAKCVLDDTVIDSYNCESDFDNDELYEMYAYGVLYPDSDISTYSIDNAGKHLEGKERVAYLKLKEKIKKAADGELDSAQFKISISELNAALDAEHKIKTSYTAKELVEAGVTTVTGEDGKPTDAAKNKLLEGVSYNSRRLFDALLNDCAYEMYWFEKTEEYSVSYPHFMYSKSGDQITNIEFSTESGQDDITFSFTVDPTYRSSESSKYSLDTAKTAAAKTAAANADAIVTAASSKSDYEKLVYYKEQICELVSYDTSASDSNPASLGTIAPWQIINVFDGNSSTNVVCEGYSKAFAYLCEKTTFSSSGIIVYPVTGTMSGGTGAGAHMWNIVHMSDGKNYLVDVTNCDDGTIGNPDKLFMRGYTNERKTAENKVVGYAIKVSDSTTMNFDYDSDTLETYEWAEIELASSDYTPGCNHIADTECGITAYYDETLGYVHNITCSKCNEDVIEPHVYGNSKAPYKCTVCNKIDLSKCSTASDLSTKYGSTIGKDIKFSEFNNSINRSDENGYKVIKLERANGQNKDVIDYEADKLYDVGTYYLTIEGTGTYFGKKTVKYTIKKADRPNDSKVGYIRINDGNSDKKYKLGQTDILKLKNLNDTYYTDSEVTYQSSNTSVVTIDNAGNVTTVGFGTAKISLTAAATTNFNQATRLINITVEGIEPPADSAIKYNGEAKKDLYGKVDGVEKAFVNITAYGYLVSDSYSGDFYSDYSMKAGDVDGQVTKTLYFKNNKEGDSQYGYISKGKEISVEFDITAPDVTINLSEDFRCEPTEVAQDHKDCSYFQQVIISFTASDAHPDKIYYGIDNEPDIVYDVYSNINPGGKKGKKTVRVKAIDKAGNVTRKEITLYIYDNAPYCSINPKENIIYDGSAIEEGDDKDFTLTKNSNAGNVSYFYKKSTEGDNEYKSGLPTDAGTYTVKVSIGPDSEHYYKSTGATKVITINKAPAELTASSATVSKTLGDSDINVGITRSKGDGTITYSSSDTSVATVDSDGKITAVGVGNTTITANMAATDNYNAASSVSVTLNVDYLAAPETASIKYNESAKKAYYGNTDGNVAISAEGYTVSDTLNGTYKDSYTIAYTADGEINKNLYFKNAAGQMTNAVEVKVKYDRTAPIFPAEGGIKIAESAWRTLLSTITFGKFFKTSQSVTVTAEDETGGSGIDKYYYYVDKSGSTTALTDEELAGKAFTESDSSTIDTISAESKYVYYVYVTDKAGNKSGYICSDGVVMDSAAPVLGEPSVLGTELLDVSAGVSVFATDSGSGVKEYYLVSGNSDLSTSVTEDNIATNASKLISENGSFSITGLSPNTKYYYAVAAIDNIGNVAIKYGNFTTKKRIPTFSTTPTVTGYLGQSLSKMTLTQVASNNGAEGTWSFVSENPASIYPSVNNPAKVGLKFTPTDTANYDVYEVEVTPSVSYFTTDSKISVGGIDENAGWVTSGTITPPSGFKIATSLGADLSTTEWKDALTYSTDGEQTVSYYLKDTATDGITAQRSYTLKIDNTKPTGSISIGSDTWGTLLNDITFGKYYKETKAVTINSSDSYSGIKSVEYLLSDSVIPDAELDGKTWTPGNSFNIEPNKKVIIYARITDNVGNKAYISSQGLVFDSNAPSVSLTPEGTTYNAVNGGTNVYDETVSVKVSAIKPSGYCDISSIKYSLDNGTATDIASGESVEINTAGVHNLAVTAIDQAGNVKSENITVTVYKTAPAMSITPGSTIKYDGRQISEGTDFTLNRGSNLGDVTYSYKVKGADDSTYINGLPVTIGSYTIKAVIEENTTSYYKRAFTTADITIIKGDASLITTSNVFNKKYGDSVFSVGITKNGDGVVSYVSSNTNVATVDSEGKVTVKGIGSTTITASMAATDNYNAAADKAVTVNVSYLAKPSGILYNNSATKKNWYNSQDGNVVISASGLTVSDALDGSYRDSYTIAYTSDGQSTKNLYFMNALGQKTDKVEISVTFDHTAPTFPAGGGLKISGNSWNTLLQTISFDIVYDKAQSITVSAKDSGSGIDKYYYYVDKSGNGKALSETELNSKSFSPKTSEIVDTMATDGKYVYYAYVTDKAGNRSSYICSNGVIFESVKPTPTPTATPTPTTAPTATPTAVPTVAPTAVPTTNIPVGKAEWKKTNGKWWYRHADGSYTKNNWEKIDGKWYHFDASGYMQTGWIGSGGKWYYLENSGAMATSKWVGAYYLKADGSMAVNEWVDNNKYYVGADGKWVKDTSKVKKPTATPTATPTKNPTKVEAGWKKSAGGWWYSYADGTYPKNCWAKIDGKYYHFNSNGYMQAGWLKDGGKWYYLKSSGEMATGWAKIGNKWYYFKSNGAMASGEWVGNYYLKADGSMAVNEWIGKYHVDANGKWDKTR